MKEEGQYQGIWGLNCGEDTGMELRIRANQN